jgi:hypothetical protein
MSSQLFQSSGKLAVVFLLLFASIALSIKVNVNVKGEIGGYIEYMDYEKIVNGTIQNFFITWYNSESVGCTIRIRIDINDGNKTYTIWSDKKPVEPGDHRDFELFWIPQHTGNYSWNVLIYACNEIFSGPNGTFEVISLSSPKKTIIIKSAKSTAEGIEIKIKAESYAKDVVIIPTNFPLGWVVEHAKINEMKKGEERTVLVKYEPATPKNERVYFKAITMDGKYESEERGVLVKKELPFWEKFGPLVAAALILSLLFNLNIVFMRYKS